MSLAASACLRLAGLLLAACSCQWLLADTGRHQPLVVTPLVEPWGFVDAEQVPRGLLVDFQRALFERAELSFQQQLRPYPRVIHDLSSGFADFGVMFKSPQADRVGISLGAVVTMRVLLVTRTDTRPFNGVADLSGLKVGYVRGSKYGAGFDDNPLFERIPVNDAEQGLRMLMTRRLDVMASTEQSLIYASVITGIPTGHLSVALELGQARADFYMSRDAGADSWRRQLASALAEMEADGSLEKIFYQHNLWPLAQYCFAGGRCLRPIKAQE